MRAAASVERAVALATALVTALVTALAAVVQPSHPTRTTMLMPTQGGRRSWADADCSRRGAAARS